MLWYYDLSRRSFLRVLGLTAASACAARAGLGAAAAGAAEVGQRPKEPLKASIARALHHASASVVTSVPATGTAAILDAYAAGASTPVPYSYNEEVAYTLAHGASLAGRRAATVIKAHGLAKAANSVIDSLTAGVSAGFVAIVTYDTLGKHSDSIFDVSDFVQGSGIPFRVLDVGDAYATLRESFRWSEELQLPVALLVDSSRLEELSPLEEQTQDHAPLPPKPVRDPYRHVLCPPLAEYQHEVLQARRAGGDWRRVERPPEIRIPDTLPPKWRALVAPYERVFRAFRPVRKNISFVAGDTGLSSMFAFAPYDCIDVTTYYGGSLPLAIGAHLAGRRSGWAVTGDYAFVAAGHMGLVEALHRSLPLKVLVLHNGCSLTTGCQPIPDEVFESVLAGYAPHVRRLPHSMDVAALTTGLAEAAHSNRMEIVVAEAPTPL